MARMFVLLLFAVTVNTQIFNSQNRLVIPDAREVVRGRNQIVLPEVLPMQQKGAHDGNLGRVSPAPAARPTALNFQCEEYARQRMEDPNEPVMRIGSPVHFTLPALVRNPENANAEQDDSNNRPAIARDFGDFVHSY